MVVSLELEISLPSGKRKKIEANSMEDLKARSQEAFNMGVLRLCGCGSGDFSDLAQGTAFQAIVVKVCLASTSTAFVLYSYSDIVSWGSPHSGGQMSAAIKSQLRHRKITEVVGTDDAFAAVLADGSVLTCGSLEYGGDISSVQHQLRNVVKVHSARGAFCALRGDGSAPRASDDLMSDVRYFIES